MKHKLIVMFASLILTFTIAQTYTFAGDLSIGGTGWYTAWDSDSGSGFKPDPAIMYGPALSYVINDSFNMTFLFLYGNFASTMDTGFGEPMNMDVTRYDSDLALNYKIGNSIKVFAGAKVLGYNYSASFSGITMTAEMLGYGPGAGISTTLPLGSDFFLLGNLSGMYLFSTMVSSSAGSPENSDTGTHYGLNTSLSLAYYLNSASTTLSLGGRYQRIHSENANDGGSAGWDTFYGVTVSAIYTFSMSAE